MYCAYCMRVGPWCVRVGIAPALSLQNMVQRLVLNFLFSLFVIIFCEPCRRPPWKQETKTLSDQMTSMHRASEVRSAFKQMWLKYHFKILYFEKSSQFLKICFTLVSVAFPSKLSGYLCYLNTYNTLTGKIVSFRSGTIVPNLLPCPCLALSGNNDQFSYIKIRTSELHKWVQWV